MNGRASQRPAEHVSPDRADPLTWSGYQLEGPSTLVLSAFAQLDAEVGCVVREYEDRVLIALLEIWAVPTPEAQWLKQTRSIAASTLVRVRLAAPLAGRPVTDLSTGRPQHPLALDGPVVEAVPVVDDDGFREVLHPSPPAV